MRFSRFILARAVEAAFLFLCALSAALAQIPAAQNCSMSQPPADSGAAAFPGGFLLVHPRNAALSDRYTGCKNIWVVDAPDRFIRIMTLYFENGRLRVAHSYNKDGSSRGTCGLPGQSPGCEEVESNPLAALRMPTWPRICIAPTNDPRCARDPE